MGFCNIMYFVLAILCIFHLQLSAFLSYNKQTAYSNSQIQHFINSLTYEMGSQRLSIWKTPILGRGNECIFNLMPLVAPNMLALIEHWLEVGGYQLENRGIIFERYLKRVFRERSMESYECKIPAKQKYCIAETNKEEEIDLILCLKKVVLIAEVKCISYPMEPRDYHNAMTIILHGVSQAKRKARFIEVNKFAFVSDLGDTSNKAFISVNMPGQNGHFDRPD